jgi:dephospho-CoA kinase
MTTAAKGPALQPRWVLGLTGGIASGKSTVAALFARLGVPVIDLDQVAREVVAPGAPLLQEIFQRFGSDLRQADGQLDRRALRARMFHDAGLRRQLEELLHPAVRAHTEQWLAAAPGPYQIVVNPLLVEKNAGDRYDRILVVDCDPTQQRARLAARDGADDTQIAAILAAQASRAERLAVADDVLVNDADLAALEARVGKLHDMYLGLAQSSSTIAG